MTLAAAERAVEQSLTHDSSQVSPCTWCTADVPSPRPAQYYCPECHNPT
jgi:predicted RNA-binding Zn-ribbon protein involved in translation (DUF1610 family)